MYNKQQDTYVLLRKVSEGDLQAKEKIIEENIGLVYTVAKKFMNRGADFEDLVQLGCIGLINAVDKFDESFNVMFSTYAVPMIMGEIKRHLKGANSLRIARSIRDTAYSALKVRGELEKNGVEVGLEEVADKMNLKVKEVAYALDAISDSVSLYDPVYSKNGDELLLVDQIGDEKNTEERWTENCAIQTAMVSLPDRERKIITLRYFEGKTQTEISEEIGISQAQVSRLEKNALKEIKQMIMA